ncbi:MAG: TonB family protein [Xanthomonadales bacterium]|nr:TonB family protein [Xanthomonadales bacterium]
MKSESLSLRHMVEPKADFQTIPNPVQTVKSLLDLHHQTATDADIELFSVADDSFPTRITLHPPADLVAVPDDAQFAPDESSFDAKTASASRQEALAQHLPTADLATNQDEIKVVPLKARPPNYPWRARKQGIEGFVELEFSVNSAGKVTDVKVLDALPEGVFEKAASRALSKWTFAGEDDSGSRFHQVFDFELQNVERGPPRSRTCAVTGSRTCGIISPDIFVVWVNETTRKTARTGLN